MNEFIDHTLLKPNATSAQIKQLCEEAMDFKFKSVCVNPSHVKLSKEILKNSDVKVCTVIGFPLGANCTKTKCFETELALENGADEFDMVINVGWLKEKLFDDLLSEINELKKIIGDCILKVIVEISLLTDDEIRIMTEIVSKSNADFIKTSTGFSAHGATLEAVKIMKDNISNDKKIKASGGIRDYKTAKSYIDLGVSRLGVSAGIEIMEEFKKQL